MTPLTIVIIVVVIVLIFIILRYMFSDPYTLQGIANGTSGSKIEYSSLATNGSNAPATNFGYSIWFYVNDWNYRYGQPKVIFGRMGGASSPGGGSVGGLSGLDPCPAVVLGPIENNISVSLGCFPGHDGKPTTSGGSTVVHTCSIANVPLQRWVNLIISVYGRSMDLYMNGKLVRTCLLPGTAAVDTTNNLYVTPLGGFEGSTTKLAYYPNALNPEQAWNIYEKGYGNGILSNLFGSYQLNISILQNGEPEASLTI